MRKAGVREARQQFSKLLDEVKQGREVVITERGRPVARLAPLRPAEGRGLPSLAWFRARMPKLDPPLSQTISEERDEW